MARKNNTVLEEADPKTRLELMKGTQDCFARGPTPSNQSRKVATSQGARTQADCSNPGVPCRLLNDTFYSALDAWLAEGSAGGGGNIYKIYGP
jgi:hypothetical protein